MPCESSAAIKASASACAGAAKRTAKAMDPTIQFVKKVSRPIHIALKRLECVGHPRRATGFNRCIPPHGHTTSTHT